MEPILTQSQVVVDLSAHAIEALLYYSDRERTHSRDHGQAATELDNFYNLLRNLLERSGGEASDNSDLI